MWGNIFWFAMGALVIMMLPPKYEDWLRQFVVSIPGRIRTLWQNITKKG